MIMSECGIRHNNSAIMILGIYRPQLQQSRLRQSTIHCQNCCTGDVKLVDGGIHFSNVKITLSFLPDAMIIQIDEKDLHAFFTFIPTILSIYSNGFTRVPVNAVSTWFAENHMTKTYPSM